MTRSSTAVELAKTLERPSPSFDTPRDVRESILSSRETNFRKELFLKLLPIQLLLNVYLSLGFNPRALGEYIITVE
jgi:hypothetical protein